MLDDLHKIWNNFGSPFFVELFKVPTNILKVINHIISKFLNIGSEEIALFFVFLGSVVAIVCMALVSYKEEIRNEFYIKSFAKDQYYVYQVVDYGRDNIFSSSKTLDEAVSQLNKAREINSQEGSEK